MTTALILAIEPDSSRAFQLKSIARQAGAELRLADSIASALAALDEHVPDLILIPAFLAAKDDVALTDRLRRLGAAAAHIQTLTIPILESADMTLFGSGVFGTPRRQKQSMGCTTDTFAEQVRIYLDRAAEARREAPQSTVASAPRVELNARDESAPVSKAAAAAETPAPAAEPLASVKESFGGIDESLEFEEELPAAAEASMTRHPPTLEEFDLEAFMSEEFLRDDSGPPDSVPAPVAPALEAPTIMIRRAISTSLPPAHADLHDFLPEDPSASLPADALLAAEELFEFAPEEPAQSEMPKRGLPLPPSQRASASAEVTAERLSLDQGWHTLDPTQARFAALLAKLDEIAARSA
jgi:CheY-like chemotaxis protein